jgi:hypothetical protein
MYLKSLIAAVSLVPMMPIAVAQAASPGFSGWARPADTACFQESWGGVVNQCSGARDYYIPFHVPTSGNKNVVIYAQGPSSASNVCCTAYGMLPTSDSTYRSPNRCLDGFGSFRQINLGAVMVPSYGSLYIACSVGSGARIKVATF